MYKIEVVFDGEVMQQGVIAPVTITNGVNSINESLTQFYCNVSVFRREFESVFTAAGKDVRFYGNGAPLQIQMTETGGASPSLIFDGLVTDTSSNRETISFTAVDKDIIYATNTQNYGGIIGAAGLDRFLYLIASNNGLPNWYQVSSPGVSPYTVRYPSDLSGLPLAQVLQIFSNDGYQALTRFNVPTFKTDPNHGTGRNYIFNNVLANADFELTDDDIDQNYDLQRQRSELANRVVLTKRPSLAAGGTSTVNDATSQAAIGIIEYNSSSCLETQALRDARAAQELKRRTDLGWPTVIYRTSYDRIANQFTDEINCYETMVPANSINVSSISEPYIQNLAIIQQVTHNFWEKHWAIELRTIDALVVGDSQTWGDVPGTVEWQDVPSELTWEMAKTFLI